ncbi:hypothetical protein R5R35_013532 [Gryllus longicercus]|uniref:Lon protease homolog n=1 Tax=Gryllus longicercus TaxID=2509291 RepID=A0AAN9VDW7_9ORTH
MPPIVSIPRRIPLLVVSNEVLLPGGSLRIPITRSENMEMVKHWILNRSPLSSVVIGIMPRDPRDDGSPLIGTAAVVVQVTGVNWPQPMITLLVTGLCRIKVEKVSLAGSFPMGTVMQLDKLSSDNVDEVDAEDPVLASLLSEFRQAVQKYLSLLDENSATALKLKAMLNSLPGHHLADVCASLVKASYTEKLEILDALDVTERLKKTLTLISRHFAEMDSSPDQSVILRKPKQRNFRIVKGHELMPMEDDEMNQLENKLNEASLPPEVHKVVMKDLNRLKKMPSFGPEKGIIRNYLEIVSDMPWSKSSKETIDIYKAQKDLDADHYAMDKLKQRVLEYLAVRQLKSNLKGPILCFVGPPGVGKTSVGRSIAQTLGREFHRISLGGVCNQSDIRGHRRTYIGAMPGRIVQGLKIVGVNNPVFLLDEIDKMGSGIHGDPAAALLEVLDPEQNCTFVDHFLNVPFDLSQVLFIATANSVKSIPPALLDRMELVNVPGYTQEEKLHIATKHLLPKQLEAHGLTPDLVHLPDESVKLIISDYTREAGVRTLERKLGALCRAVAVQVAEEKFPSPSGEKISTLATSFPVDLDPLRVEKILGPAIFSKADLWSRLGQPGVAVGLAWTSAGGEVMLVEASKMEGDGELVLTGHLGDVMKESARLALNWVRTQASKYGLKLNGETLAHTDLHIHFPAGAVGKDGPSAGITVATALMSLFSSKPVASDVAMTGEITLQGVVLPVGGVKEKVLAAHRAGLRRIILPQKCEKDLLEIPSSVKEELVFVFVSHIDEVLQAAFDGGLPFVGSQSIEFTSKL